MSRRSDHRLAVEPLISHRFPFARAEEAYRLVTERTEPHLGVVLNYDRADRPGIAFWIRDSGPGVQPDEARSIFRRFSRGTGGGSRTHRTGAVCQ